MLGTLNKQSKKKDKNGMFSWRGRVDVKTRDGKRKQISKTFYAKTETEAKRLCNKWAIETQEEHENAVNSATEDITVEEVIKEWLQSIEESVDAGNAKQSTYDSYYFATRHTISVIGKLPASEISYDDLRTLFLHLNKFKKNNGSKLNSKYVIYHWKVLKMAYKFAVKGKKYLSYNPLLELEDEISDVLPKVDNNNRHRICEDDEFETFVFAASHCKFPLLAKISRFVRDTGLRRSEALGMKWPGLKLEGDEKEVSVENQIQKRKKAFHIIDTKTSHSKRDVPLFDTTAEMLLQHKAEQDRQKAEMKDCYDDQGYVFANELGQPYDPNYVTMWFRTIAKELGMEGIGLHSLRHTYASEMIRAGNDVGVISELLGHHDKGFTLKTYTHLFKEQKKEAAKKVQMLRASTSQNKPPVTNPVTKL